MRANELLEGLRGGRFDERLRAVYGADGVQTARERIASVAAGFRANFDPDGTRELMIFSAPGRTELGGNHTDHQNGCALAAGVDLDTLACASPGGGEAIRVLSRGHHPIEADVRDLAVRESDRSRSRALVRGVAARAAELGCPLAGFDAYTETRVLRGSGLSSSAAFEVLVGRIISELGGAGFDALRLAQIGQYAENVYYGKPCGLLDQLACATGGVVAADFADPLSPVVRRCALDLESRGFALVVVDSGSGHSDLDDAYAAIPAECCAVARLFGKERLGEVDEAEFWRRRDEARAALGERPALRAEHFFEESRRAVEEYEALAAGDLTRYLALVRASGESSEKKLQNVVLDRPDGDRLQRAIDAARRLAGPEGAARVHGGGFAGTAQAYVPLPRLSAFVAGMEAEFGAGCCHVLHIRDAGVTRLI